MRRKAWSVILLVGVLCLAPQSAWSDQWVNIGPDGDPGPDGRGIDSTGRVNALAFDPGDPNVLYAGSALGGLWKSSDRGGRWMPLGDHRGLPNLGVGAIAVAGDGTIYLGTGDLNGNFAVLAEFGGGVVKSTDGGVHWNPTGTASCIGDDLVGQSARILLDLANPEIVWVAADDGLYRSMDGGGCWHRLLTGRVTDIAMKPDDPATLYVGGALPGTIQKTTNGRDPSPTFAPVGALPATEASPRVVFAVTPADPAKLYVSLAVRDHVDILRSDDGAATWTLGSQQVCTVQCDYGVAIAVSPRNPLQVIYGEVFSNISTDGGISFTRLLVDGNYHVDFHAFAFPPDDPNTVYAATDGGVYVRPFPSSSDPISTSGWQPKNMGLAIAQALVLALAPTDPQAAVVGTWDNSTQMRVAGHVWRRIGGGDGFNAAIDASGSDVVFFNSNAGLSGDIRRSTDFADFGDAAGFVSNPYRAGEFLVFLPLIAGTTHAGMYVTEDAQSAPGPMYSCADPRPDAPIGYRVEFGTDGWYYVVGAPGDGSLTQLHIAPNHPIIQDCASGTSASDITPIVPVVGGQVIREAYSSVVLDPFDPNSLYALTANNGFDRLVKLTRSGSNWSLTSLDSFLDSQRLPLFYVTAPGGVFLTIAPLNLTALAADPADPNVLYVGTDHGLYTGRRDSDRQYAWTLDPNVPDTFIFTIVAHRSSAGYSGVVRLSTFGRSVWELQRTPKNRPPDCSSAVAEPSVLWPPNHTLQTVSVQGVTDPDGDPVRVTITGISQDEPLTGSGTGSTCPDAGGVGTSTAVLRAERSGLTTADGRTYHVSFTADDGKGGQCTGAVSVCVPYDQLPGTGHRICIDEGPLVDSTGPCK